LHGIPYHNAGIGDAEFASGYPFFGALFRFITGDAIRSLQALNWMAAGASLWAFDGVLRIVTPGALPRSRLLYGVLLGLAPVFLRSGMVVMSDMPALCCALIAVWQGLQVLEGREARALWWFALAAGIAVLMRYACAPLLAPFGLILMYRLAVRQRWLPLMVLLIAALSVLMLHVWLKTGAPRSALNHDLFSDWSPLHWFSRQFENANGRSAYPLPNLLFLLYPLAYPGFCVLLPLFFLMSKRTDVLLPVQKIIAACLLFYLLFLGGLPHQNARHLLPAWVLLLVLLFPAWDRIISYGFYFLKLRHMHLILGTGVAIQVAFCAYFLQQPVARGHMEQRMAQGLSAALPAPDAVVYAFDVDVALRSYLPTVQWKSLWAQRYGAFEPGSLWLFNEPLLRRQWEGYNPMLNWTDAQARYHLQPIQVLEQGWTIYRVQTK
jgi:4-amino-4-deoxy-L-arabinose transferase-like glycosyltransferase